MNVESEGGFQPENFAEPSHKPEGVEFDSKEQGEKLRAELLDISKKYNELATGAYLQYFDKVDFATLLRNLENKSYQINTQLDYLNLAAIAEKMNNCLVSISGAKLGGNQDIKNIGLRASEMVGQEIRAILAMNEEDAFNYIKENSRSDRLRDVIDAYTKFKGENPATRRLFPDFIYNK